LAVKPVALIILDGYGIREDTLKNAIAAANKPNLDALFARWPHTLIAASGAAVGLPEGQPGNSEVGHTNMGAGRIVWQELSRINLSIENGSFAQNAALAGAMEHCLITGRSLHLMGLLSDGGVHSHIEHLYAILALAAERGLKRVFVHCFLDGRDTSPTAGAGYLAALQKKLSACGVGGIATVTGRYYAMDRDKRWERTRRAYEAMTLGVGEAAADPVRAVESRYGQGETDEFLTPVVLDPKGRVSPEDAVVFFNFRPDRARQITQAFIDPDFSGFARQGGYIAPHFVAMTAYWENMQNAVVAFPDEEIRQTLGEHLSFLGKRQLRAAETEKYAHVTFFFNGGNETPYPGEERLLVPSPKVATYDLQPEMSAAELTEKLLPMIDSNRYDFIVVNYANCDMVGHTGIFEAAVRAVETVDRCAGQLVEHILKAGGIALITADHGNADQMIERDGNPLTSHTASLVPFLVAGRQVALASGGKLADLAPTALDLMELPVPPLMTGRSLITG
jgi:2,3-bisphosphoglycerate-independent phosphoglycerate mutase